MAYRSARSKRRPVAARNFKPCGRLLCFVDSVAIAYDEARGRLQAARPLRGPAFEKTNGRNKKTRGALLAERFTSKMQNQESQSFGENDDKAWKRDA